MKVTRRLGAVAVALTILAVAHPASAQFSLGGMNVEGEVEAGLRLLPGEPSRTQRGKFEEYRDFTEGPFLQGLQLRIFRPDESYSASFAGSKWGQQDQEFALKAGRLGLWEFGFDWDQTPHLFSTTARMLGTQTAPNVFTLPTPRPSLSAYNSAPLVGDVGVRWDTARTTFSVTPTPDLEFRVEYTRIKKDGERPFSMAFASPGGNFREILEPIDQTVHDVRLKWTMARETWQLQGGYTFSAFENGFRSVTADNPCFGLTAALTAASPGCGADATGAQPTGLISTAPNNVAHTVNLGGGITLPWWRTRLTANASYSLRLQNDSFLGYTANSAVVSSSALTLPAPSLDGKVGVTSANVNLTSRPLTPLTLTARYRIFDYHDSSPELRFPGDVVNDRTLALGEFVVPRYNFTRQNADLEGRWRFGAPLAMTLGTGWEGWHRNENREVQNSDEYFAKLALDATPTDWFLGRLTYRPSFRRIGRYNTDSPAQAGSIDSISLSSINLGQSLFLRKFDEADRDTQRVDLLLQFTPTDTLTASITGGWRFDDYLHSPLGLQEGTTWSAGADVAWTPVERVSFSAGYVHEVIFQKQQSQSRIVNSDNSVPFFPDYLWLSNNIDTVDTVYAGANVALIPGRLDWKVGVNFSTATGDVLTRNPNGAPVNGTAAQNFTASAKRMPAFDDTLTRVDTALRYHFSRAWTVGLAYAFESFTKHDWRTDTLNPFVPGATTSIWLGNDAKNYTAHIVALTLGYRFK
jgi:MtrB/PioB family decaheme-associated outer membrane protein